MSVSQTRVHRKPGVCDDPSKQCMRMRSRGRGQCKNWQMRGSKFCAKHGGRRYRKQFNSVNNSHLPRFYRKVLTPTLQEAVEQGIGLPPNEQLSFYEELALTRHSAEQAILLYTIALDSKDSNSIMLAGEVMRHQLRQVIDVGLRIAQIESTMKDKITVAHVSQIVDQIVRCAHASMDETDAKRFEETVRNTVRLPTDASAGTQVTPDMDVSEMDELVPREETA